MSIQLTPGQSAVIEALSHAPDGMAHNSLIAAIYGGEEPEDPMRVLMTHVCRIRAKAKAAGWSGLIATMHGTGYRLTQPVVVNAPRPVIIPHNLRPTLERLLYSHPDQTAADQVLASFCAV